DNPKAAFRSVRGLVLAVFLGTAVAGLVPAVNSVTATRSAGALNNVLLDAFAGDPTSAGLAPRAGAAPVGEPRGVRGATVFPLYAAPGAYPGPNRYGNNAIIGCTTLRQLAVLGACAPGDRAVAANDGNLIFSDNPVFSTQAFVNHRSPAFPGSLANL